MRKLSIILILAILISGCSGKPVETAKEENLTGVRVKAVKKEVKEKRISGIGTVTADETKKLSFKVSGKIRHILVENGTKIKPGMPLVQIDTKDLQYNLSVAKSQMESARALYDKTQKGAREEDLAYALLDFEKAESVYAQTGNDYQRVVKLYESGAFSSSELEKAKMEYEASKTTMEQAEKLYLKLKNGASAEELLQAKASYDMAVAAYGHSQDMLADAVLLSDTDGYVVQVLFKEGEIVTAGYPVIVVRDSKEKVSVSINHKQLENINKGNRTIIYSEGKSIEGIVTSVSDIPDEEIQTYSAEVAFEDSVFKIGEIVRVDIFFGTEEAVWLPIDTIMSDGDNYVYIVSDGRIEKRNVELCEERGNEVRVSGLSDGEWVVVENASKVKAGEKVKVLY